MHPRYSVRSENREGIEVVVLRDGDDARAEVAPRLGNNCFAFGSALPVLEPVSFAEFRRKPTSYGIPLLFPFPNRLRDGAFIFEDRAYRVDPPRHGFVRDKSWRVVEMGASDEAGAWVRSEIQASDYPREILTQFPFPFTFEVTHRLRDAALELHAVASNTGRLNMPVGFGLHPYFRKPERGKIQVPAAKRWELADSLPTGALVELNADFDLRQARDIEGLRLDDIYTDAIADSHDDVCCSLSDDVNGVKTLVEFSRLQFPNIVVYTPPAPRAALCIEPNSCPTDAFNLQQRGIAADVIVLEPGRRVEFDVRIRSTKVDRT